MQFPATLVFGGRKVPPRKREHFLKLDLSISCNFQQLWLLVAEKPPPPPPRNRENFFRLDLSISWQFPATLVFGGRTARPLPPEQGKLLNWIYPFHAISSNFGFWWQKRPPPPPKGTGKTFYTRSIHFMQFPATLVSGGRTPPPIHTRTSTARGLPPVMKDYLPGTITHLVIILNRRKDYFYVSLNKNRYLLLPEQITIICYARHPKDDTSYFNYRLRVLR